MSNFPLIKELEDDQYPYDYIDHQRIIARGIILNENNEVALIYIKGKDIFGERDYYETPGGGVNDGEDLYEGVLREVEEMSYEDIAKVLKCPVGTVRSRIFRARNIVEEAISV